MIERQLASYKKADRDVTALGCVVALFLALLVGYAMWLGFERKYDELLKLMPQAIPLLSVLVVVRVANRALLNADIIRIDDRRQEIVRTTHHLIAIATDLKERVGYAKAMFIEGGRPIIAFVQISKSIEDRYEALLDRDAYKYLPGPCVDLISKMSADIFGISTLAGLVGLKISEKSELATSLMPANIAPEVSLRFDSLLAEIAEVIGHLFALRSSIEPAKNR
ncbi:hypothetical protein ACS5PK_08310 [Roseateles sp. DB2]|uniref:hypothetical protein n=1 Tax=Roseateles sp. DB2 TaxID=3453717 RepID=UPI003EEBBF63